jgi:vitamin B12 transporter
MTTRLFVLFYASALAVAIAGEAPSVSGSVKDPQGRPVAGASISLFSRSSNTVAATTSNSQGAYRFEGTAPGEYLLRAEAPGFAVFLEERLHVDAPLTRDISLALAGVREQVVVTASGTSQSADEVSKSVTVIDRSELEQRDVFPLTDAVDLAPAVRVQTLGGPGQEASIHIRGMRDIDTAVLVDGMRLRDAAILHGDATGLIEDLLSVNPSRVEVLNGAGSSLYGTSAIGGVVNILTDEGGGRTRGSVLTEGGSLGTMRGRAQVAGGGLNDRLQYSAGLAYMDVTRGVDGDDPFRDASVQGSLSYRLSSTTLLRARLFGGDSFAKINSNPTQAATVPASGIIEAIPFVTFLPGADDPDNRRAARFLNGALSLEGQPLAKLNYSLSFQTLASGRRYANGPAGGGYQFLGTQRYDGRIQTANAQVHYQPSATHLLTGGYEFENENYAFDFANAGDPGAASAVNVTQKSNALFVQDQTRWLGGRLMVTGGFRAQYFTLDRPLFLPAASAPYQGISFASPPAAYTGDGSAAYFIRKTNTKVRGHVGRGYRVPSLYERFGTGFDSVYGYTTLGDPRLAPEHSISFDAGIDQSFAKGHARASATYFYTRLQQVIAFANSLNGTDPFGRFLGYYNSQGGLSRGVETNVAVSPVAGLNVSASYTFVNAVERTPIVGNNLRTFVIPRHQFSASAAWRAGKRTLVTFDTLDAGNYLAPVFSEATFQSRVYRFDGLRRINAGASYRLPLGEFHSMRFFVRAENLLDQNYFENGFRTPRRTASGGIQFEF